MFFGIGFLTIITAAITSTFVARSRLEFEQADTESPTVEHFRQLDRRLERIEAALAGSTRVERDPRARVRRVGSTARRQIHPIGMR